LGKKSSQKCAKKRFLYSLEYHDQKMVGKKMRETIFPETHEWFAQKCWEYNCRLKVQNVFYIHTNIVTKKVGGKTRTIIFPETHE